MIRIISIMVAALFISPIVRAVEINNSAGSKSASVLEADEETVPAENLKFYPFGSFLDEHSSGRGTVNWYALDKLSSGVGISIQRYDEYMILLVGLRELEEHCDEEDVRAALRVIGYGMESPLLRSVQESLGVLHRWLQKKIE